MFKEEMDKLWAELESLRNEINSEVIDILQNELETQVKIRNPAEQESLILTWHTGDNILIPIGTLTRLNKTQFSFEYGFDIIYAMLKGFMPLISFPEIHRKYTSSYLFHTFSSRIPPKNRADIKNILDKYGLDHYDEFELLKKSGGKLPIDKLQFVEYTEWQKSTLKK